MPMVETHNPTLQGNPGRLIRLAGIVTTDTGVLVEIEVPVENGVLPPQRAPAVKQPAPAAPDPEVDKEQPQPVQPAERKPG